MKQVTVSRVIPTSPEKVFSVIPEPQGPFFVKNRVVSTSIISNQSTGVGTTYRWDFHFPFGINYHFDEIITEWVVSERFSYRGISGPEILSEITLKPQSNGTLVIFTIRYDIKGFIRFFIPAWLVRFGAKQGLVNIHHSVESKFYNSPALT